MALLRPPKVVIDTNVVLSALVFTKGHVTNLRQAWQAHRIKPLASSSSTTELIRVLGYSKFKLSTVEQHELLADFLPYCELVTIPKPPPITPVCRDAFDVPFLELALAGNAEALITGDKDLLSLSGKFGCQIVTAEEFLRTRKL